MSCSHELCRGAKEEGDSQLQIASDLNYIQAEQLDALRPQFTEVAKMLSGLRNRIQKQIDGDGGA